MNSLDSEQVTFSPSSIVDDAGKVFFHQGRVCRAIFSREHAELYAAILQSDWIEETFGCGLVKTWIPGDLSLQDAALTLEHQAIPFETHPVEFTDHMHWLAAKAIVKVNLSLARHGLILKDAHPWNVMFDRGSATVIDFGSIVRVASVASVPLSWLEEYYTYFCVPLWLASTRWQDYAREYRRQHRNGFGLQIFQGKLFKRLVIRGISQLNRHLSSPVDFFSHLDNWLEKHRPLKVPKEAWADYQQCGEELDPLRPEHPKQKFVHDILQGVNPAKVLDFAANKGYYSEMAARLGASVVACDYEQYCVDECLTLARENNLPITPALLDFSWPTPSYGMGLCGRDAYGRLQADVVLALGLVHHICITQRVPVEVFCDICMKYATKGVVVEYVDPTDKHVAGWGRPTPVNYSIEGISKCFGKKFPRINSSEKITRDGLNRVMIYFGLE